MNYIAGLWDGDGSISLTHQASLRIGSGDREVLDWIHQTIGSGRVYQRPRAPSHTKDHYVYTLSRSADLRVFLPQLLRHSRIRRKAQRIREVLAWLEEHK